MYLCISIFMGTGYLRAKYSVKFRVWEERHIKFRFKTSVLYLYLPKKLHGRIDTTTVWTSSKKDDKSVSIQRNTLTKRRFDQSWSITRGKTDPKISHQMIKLRGDNIAGPLPVPCWTLPTAVPGRSDSEK